MLRADELAAIRGAVDAFLPDFCSISRGGVLLSPQPTMKDGSVLRCDVRPDKPVLIPGAGPLEHQEQWKIVLPDGTPVRAFDRIAALGNIYSVVLDHNPNSRSSQTNVYAIQLYGPDADGNPTVPVYLRANAVVSFTRLGRPVAQATAIPARIGTATPEQFDGSGGLLPYKVYLVPGPTLQDNDLLTVVFYPNNPALVGRVATIKDPVYDGSVVPLTSMSAAFRSQP